MNKYVKYFIMFVIFFNCLFGTVQDVFANFKPQVAGPRDRIRHYNVPSTREGQRSVIEYKYNTTDGFSCYPDNLKYFSDSKLLSIGENIGVWTWDIFVNIFLAPFLCLGTLSAISSSVSSSNGKSLMGSLGLILVAFASSGLERLEELIFAEDDYNLDPTNPSCQDIYIGMIISCLVMVVVMKLKIQFWIKVIIIVVIATVIYSVKRGIGKTRYDDAKEVYNRLSLCGDNWLTYGNNNLKQELDKSGAFTSNTDINFNYIKAYFPTKGDFFGSYKYTLQDCFQSKNVDTCKKLFGNSTNIENINTIDNLSSTTNKQYREFIYDGMEYAYTGCKDPRPERKYYLGTIDKTSQLYYFKGTDAANFACDRFLGSSKTEYMEAYKCCLEASQHLICISNKNRNDPKATEYYTMCSKDASTGDCSIQSDYTLNTENSNSDNVCTDLKNQIEKLKTNTSINSEDNPFDLTEIEAQYNTYCDEQGNVKNDIVGSSAITTNNSNAHEDANTITFKIRQSSYNQNKYCVETYNLCPYNFRILGGSEEASKQFTQTYEGGYKVKLKEGNEEIYIEDASNEIQALNTENNCTFDADGNKRCTGPCFDGEETTACYNKPANFCQLDRHCVLIPDLIEPEPINSTPYIDKACMDFVGSSHNFMNYTTPLNAKNTKLFTAPFIECFVETFKNLLLNKAGHTRCVLGNEQADENNTCPSGEVYKKGEDLNENEYPSPFKTLKKYFSAIIKVLLAIFVVLYGFNMVLYKKGFSSEEVLKTIFTIVTVSYFTLNNNWISYVFNGIYSAMNAVSSFAINISISDRQNVGYDNSKYSGCYFFKHDEIANNYQNYGDRQYLAVFDTLDCKLYRYFGFSTEYITAPPILSYFISGILSFGFTLILILPFILVMLSLIFFAIKIAYQFIFNSLTLTLLLFISPIMIPMYLLKKTKGFFSSWIKKIFSCIFTPLFIIMSLSLFILIFDKYFIGDAVFYGTREPIRDVYCGKICKISESNFYYITDSNDDAEMTNKINECTNNAKGKVINLSQEAPICASMFRNATNNSGSTLFDFIIEGFTGFPAVFEGATDIFDLFLSMMFLLVIIFIFDQFTSYIGEMSSTIFGSSVPKTDGIPDLKTILGGTASIFAKISNKSMEGLKIVGNTAINQYQKRKGTGTIKETANRNNAVEKEDKIKRYNEMNKKNEINNDGNNKNETTNSDSNTNIDT
ncbi:MAG: type IV secretion system protein [Rickettsiales bacterium]|nr:type IV secretion system protein [Rickettsiales bacterium]